MYCHIYVVHTQIQKPIQDKIVLDKVMSLRISISKNEEYASKLQMVDSYLLKKEKEHINSNPNHLITSILKYLAERFQPDPPIQLQFYHIKSIIFDKTNHKTYYIHYQPIPPHKKFLLKILGNVSLQMQVKIDDKRPIKYNIHGSKAVVIQERIWQLINIDIQVTTVSQFSNVRLCCQTIQASFQSKNSKSKVKSEEIDLEINNYLLQNRGRSADIIRSRSSQKINIHPQSNHKNIIIMSDTHYSQSHFPNYLQSTLINNIQTKREFLQFQSSKSKYLNHVKKMSPEKTSFLRLKQRQYFDSKKEHIRKLVNIIYVAKLGAFIRQQRIKYHSKVMKEIKLNMLCKDFIKIIKNKFKLKITEKARYRMTVLKSIKFVSEVINFSAMKNARQNIINALIPYMDFHMIKSVGENSVYYLERIHILQKYMKSKIKDRRERVKIIIKKIEGQINVKLDVNQEEEIVRKYLKECLNKSTGRWTLGLAANRNKVLQQILDLQLKNSQ